MVALQFCYLPIGRPQTITWKRSSTSSCTSPSTSTLTSVCLWYPFPTDTTSDEYAGKLPSFWGCASCCCCCSDSGMYTRLSIFSLWLCVETHVWFNRALPVSFRLALGPMSPLRKTAMILPFEVPT